MSHPKTVLLAANVLCLILAASVAFGQEDRVSSPQQALVDNASLRVTSINITETAIPLPASKYDRVLVALAPVTVTEAGGPPLSLKSGDVRFVAAGRKVTAVGEASGSVVKILELKHHWDAPIRYCEFPANCAHENLDVSTTTNLFTNGFITAARHKVLRHGGLESSYYSAKGKNSILFVALTDVSATFGGIEEKLKSGQVYFTTQSPVDVEGGETGAEWVVVRLNEPKVALSLGATTRESSGLASGKTQPYLQLDDQQLRALVENTRKLQRGDSRQKVETLLGKPSSDDVATTKKEGKFIGRFVKYYARKQDKELVNELHDQYVMFRFDANDHLTEIISSNVAGIDNRP